MTVDVAQMAPVVSEIVDRTDPGHLVAWTIDQQGTYTVFWHGTPRDDVAAMIAAQQFPSRIVQVPYSREQLEQEATRLTDLPDVVAVGPAPTYDRLAVQVKNPYADVTSSLPVEVWQVDGRSEPVRLR